MQQYIDRSTGVGTAIIDLVSGLLERIGPSVFSLIGAFMFLSGIGFFLLYNDLADFLTTLGLINLSFYGALGGTIALCGVLLARSDVSAERIPRATAWVACGVGFLVVLNAPIIGFLASSMPSEFLLGWVMGIVGTGSTAGAVVGTVEARSIERAHLNQHLLTERRVAERYADQLDYLNGLLRHEVLNNVSIVKGYAEVCLGQPEKRPDELQVIHRQSEEMTTVISDVRVLMESLQGTYTLEERDLSAVLTAELAHVRSLAGDDVEVVASVPDDVGVLGDELLPRIFRNLFLNAVEHNDRPRPRIEVSVTASDGAVAVRVADNGPGIGRSERETLFQRRHRADHGLGLYLVHELVERYGGSIELADTGPGGTEFLVTLPCAPDPAPSLPSVTGDGDDATLGMYATTG